MPRDRSLRRLASVHRRERLLRSRRTDRRSDPDRSWPDDALGEHRRSGHSRMSSPDEPGPTVMDCRPLGSWPRQSWKAGISNAVLHAAGISREQSVPRRARGWRMRDGRWNTAFCSPCPFQATIDWSRPELDSRVSVYSTFTRFLRGSRQPTSGGFTCGRSQALLMAFT